MRKLTISALAVLSMGCCLSTAADAAVGRHIGAVAAVSQVERAGCYRLGETGYHWYRFCFGPYWLYPHQRHCRHGYCYYR